MKKNKGLKLSEKKTIELDLICKSLVGNKIEIIDSTNSKQIGLKGVLVYESAKLFYVDISGKVKRIFKNTVTIQTTYNKRKVNILGYALLGTLTQRIKKIK